MPYMRCIFHAIIKNPLKHHQIYTKSNPNLRKFLPSTFYAPCAKFFFSWSIISLTFCALALFSSNS